MSKRRKSIRQNDARVLLSEVLPYELPPTFNNRGFYDFLKRLGLKKVDGHWYAKYLGPGTEAVLSTILAEPVALDASKVGSHSRVLATAPSKSRRNVYPQTVPLQYSVRHKANEIRGLAMVHPRAQIDISEFYATYSDLMLYYTSRSPYSLRRPHKRARYSVTRDWLFENNQSNETHGVEFSDYEYEWVRSYFTYEKFSNGFQFYDSPSYRRCERKYGYLVKVDVAKCFDSIYTHSISWATHGRDLIKDHIPASSGTFGGTFDQLMQALNHDETSGLLIGSEVSRIFAEIILQAVDDQIESELRSRQLILGTDYEIHRYVDDYFVFLGDPAHRDLVIEVIARHLRPFKLHLNAAKEEGEHTPWASPLTVAKRRVRDLISNSVSIPDIPNANSETLGSALPASRASADELVVGYKSTLIDTGASHNDLANYTLARTERRVEKVIRRSQEVLATIHSGTDLMAIEAHVRATTSALLQLVEFAFFAYSGSPRVSPGVKVARILSTILQFSRSPHVRLHDREQIESKIHDEILMQLNRKNRSERAGIETATLVDCLSDLDSFYALKATEIQRVFEMNRTPTGELTLPESAHPMLVFSLIMHIKDRSGYDEVRSAIDTWLIDQSRLPLHHASRALVVLNSLACPYISSAVKDRLLVEGGVSRADERRGARELVDRWNVDWRGFDLYSALQQKRLYEVY